MRKKILSLVVILVIIVLAVYFIKPTSKVKNGEVPTIKVGVLVPFTGGSAFAGPEFQKGVELALDDLALNSKDLKVQAVFEDDQSGNPTAATNATKKLLEVDKVDIVIIPSDLIAEVIGPIFNTKQVPLLVFWDANRAVDKIGPYVYSSGYVTELAGKRIAEYAASKLGTKTAYIVNSNDVWGNTTATSFKEAYEATGGRIVGNEKINSGSTDFKTIIAKIKSEKPDAVYFPISSMSSLTAFIKQARDIKLESEMLTGDWLLPNVISDLGIMANGIHFTNVYTPQAEILAAKYKAKYSKDPMVIDWVAFTYDSINIIAKSAETSILKGHDLNSGLAGTKMDGVGGSIIIGNKDFLNNRTESIFKIIDKSPTLVK